MPDNNLPWVWANGPLPAPELWLTYPPLTVGQVWIAHLPLYDKNLRRYHRVGRAYVAPNYTVVIQAGSKVLISAWSSPTQTLIITALSGEAYNIYFDHFQQAFQYHHD